LEDYPIPLILVSQYFTDIKSQEILETGFKNIIQILSIMKDLDLKLHPLQFHSKMNFNQLKNKQDTSLIEKSFTSAIFILNEY
jgi:hypothetical protein